MSQSGLTSRRRCRMPEMSCARENKKWQSLKMKYEKKVDEDAKILALQSIMPETLFGEAGVFRRRSFNLYTNLRTAIINYVSGKVPV